MRRIFILCLLLINSILCGRAQITVDELYKLARENYPLIKQYDLIERSSEYSIANAVKGYLPQVSFSVMATYQSDVMSFPDELLQSYSAMGVDFEGLNKDQYKTEIEINQAIWDGGRIKVQKEMEKASKNVSLQTVETELYSLRERVSQLFFGLLILREQLSQNKLFQELLESNSQSVKTCIANGVALESDLNMIRVEQLSASQQKVQIESAIKAYLAMLSTLTGTEITDISQLEKPAISSASVLMVNEPVNRPELKLYDEQFARYEVQKKALSVASRPYLGLFAQGFYGNPGLNMFQDMLDNKWTLNGIAGITFKWDFGSLYTKKGNMEKLRLAQQQISNQKDIFLFNNTLQQIEQRNSINRMYNLLADDDEIIELRTAIRKSSESKMSNGVMLVRDLLKDITSENQARLSKSIHEIELLKNIYELKNTINN